MTTKDYIFLCTCIDRSGAYSFWPVCFSVCQCVHLSICLSTKTFTMTITFDWQDLGSSYFTWVYLVTRPFCWYKVQGYQSRLRSNTIDTVFEKMAVAGAFVFYKHSLVVIKLDPDFSWIKNFNYCIYQKTIFQIWQNSEQMPYGMWLKMVKRGLWKGKKTLSKKEKIITISIFSFSHIVLISLLSQGY